MFQYVSSGMLKHSRRQVLQTHPEGQNIRYQADCADPNVTRIMHRNALKHTISRRETQKIQPRLNPSRSPTFFSIFRKWNFANGCTAAKIMHIYSRFLASFGRSYARSWSVCRDAATVGGKDERAGAIHQLADAWLDNQPVPLRVSNEYSYSVRRRGGRLWMDHC